MDGFWQRLKQRKLVQWALAYIAAAFAIIQVLDVVAQRFGWPDRIEKLLILALAIGFFVTLVLAWYHGEKGAQKIGGVELLILALLLAIGGGALWAYARVPRAAPHPAVAAVAKALPPKAAARAPVPPPVSIPEKSVAVLPFENDSGQKDQQYFSDGLSQDLITALTQFAGLKVISRDSAFQFRNAKDSSAKIGELLGVAHLLEGSVQREGDEVRISVTLVNAADGSVAWSRQYDKPYKDLFALQDDITHSVADALKAKLLTAPGAVVQSERPPSGNLDAYLAYERGVDFIHQTTASSQRKAIAAFDEAIRLDPNYAAAYARLSSAWVGLAAVYEAVPTDQAFAKATAAVATALKLDADSAQAQHAQSFLLLMQMDWAGAAAAARRALQLAPEDGDAKQQVAYLSAILGNSRQAIVLVRQVLQTDPRSAWDYIQLGGYLAAQGRLDEAVAADQTAIALQPGAEGFYEQLAGIEIQRGDAAAALADAQREPPGIWRDAAVMLALQAGPDRKAADAALQREIAQYGDTEPYLIAQAYAVRGDPDAVFAWLDRAWASRDATISELLWDPIILRYRDDPRFAAFCKKVGLPATTDAVAMKM